VAIRRDVEQGVVVGFELARLVGGARTVLAVSAVA
jgi:hypothetical protein